MINGWQRVWPVYLSAVPRMYPRAVCAGHLHLCTDHQLPSQKNGINGQEGFPKREDPVRGRFWRSQFEKTGLRDGLLSTFPRGRTGSDEHWQRSMYIAAWTNTPVAC